MKFNIYAEVCCDYCNEIVHNHIDCPACNEKCASTDAYLDLYDEEVGFVLTCECCNAMFKLIDQKGFRDEWEWEQITSEN